MFILIFFIFPFINQIVPMQPIQTKTYVEGKILIKTVNDTGDKGSEFELAKNEEYKVIEGKVYKGQMAYATFQTREDGTFLIELPPGEYGIIEYDRPEKFTLPEKNKLLLWDKQCLKARWSKPLKTLSIKISEPVHVKIKIQRYHPTQDPCRQAKD